MNTPIAAERFRTELGTLFEEIFETHHGIVLDKGTSLLETLAGISAERASRPFHPAGATLAAHIEHVDFYLGVLEHYLAGGEAPKPDWRAIWNGDGVVTPEAWDALRNRLRASHQRIQAALAAVPDWNDGDRLGAGIAMVVHTALHLGIIRQALRTLD